MSANKFCCFPKVDGLKQRNSRKLHTRCTEPMIHLFSTEMQYPRNPKLKVIHCWFGFYLEAGRKSLLRHNRSHLLDLIDALTKNIDVADVNLEKVSGAYRPSPVPSLFRLPSFSAWLYLSYEI